MISVLIECHNQERPLAATLAALVPGAVDGLISEVIVFDHGSEDGTASIADAAGCRFVAASALAETLATTRSEWLLLLEPGACPMVGWIECVSVHIGTDTRPARFRRWRPRKASILTRYRERRSPLSYGLLINRRLAGEPVRTARRLRDLAAGQRAVRLDCAIIPAERPRA